MSAWFYLQIPSANADARTLFHGARCLSTLVCRATAPSGSLRSDDEARSKLTFPRRAPCGKPEPSLTLRKCREKKRAGVGAPVGRNTQTARAKRLARATLRTVDLRSRSRCDLPHRKQQFCPASPEADRAPHATALRLLDRQCLRNAGSDVLPKRASTCWNLAESRTISSP
jgi:hypothetical protein